MTRDPHTIRRLGRSALMLTAAVLLSGCIFGGEEEVVERPETIFMSANADQFVSELEAEIEWLAANDPAKAEQLNSAIIQIAGIEKLAVDPNAFEGEGPAMPDFASIDPKSPEVLRLIYGTVEDRMARGVLVDDFPSIADVHIEVGAEKYRDAAEEAIDTLEARRGQLRERQEQVRSIGGQVAFVKPLIGEWTDTTTGLTGQVVNLGPLPLVEMGLRVSKPEELTAGPNGGRELDDLTDLAMADLVIAFDPPLRSKETRALRGHAATIEGEAPQNMKALTGPVVVAVRHVTPLEGGRLTGDEYAPALDYLDDLQRQVEEFSETAPEKLRASTRQIGG